ncbi:hypothetical protein [Ammonifex thiophilus]|uniref:Uncharacterized protein n=1 Tax=Ammonifex thiophilus TaxID=444093 RepID=A0A3D8P1P4_9THEO|nr:hypothetical protein [Ammonifex thiophilus]RDV81793.1 hypothetical protein DXX99_08815 [Ammonifex thiophilus]
MSRELALARGRFTQAERHLARAREADSFWPPGEEVRRAMWWVLAAGADLWLRELGGESRAVRGGFAFRDAEGFQWLFLFPYQGLLREVLKDFEPPVIAKVLAVGEGVALSLAEEALEVLRPGVVVCLWLLRGEELVALDVRELAWHLGREAALRGGPARACGGDLGAYSLLRKCAEFCFGGRK